MKTEHFRKKLEGQKAALESEMGKIGRKNPAVPGDWEPAPLEEDIESDPIDQADVITVRDNNASILADLEARYDTILAALSRIEKKEYNKAIRKYEKAIELKPDFADTYFNLGIIYRLNGKLNKVQGFFERAIELNPSFKEKIEKLGWKM